MSALTNGWHAAIVLELMIIFIVGAYLQHGYRTGIRLLSRALFLMGYVYGAVLVVVAIAVAVNLATATTPTPGARIVAIGLAPLASVALVVLARVLHARRPDGR